MLAVNVLRSMFLRNMMREDEDVFSGAYEIYLFSILFIVAIVKINSIITMVLFSIVISNLNLTFYNFWMT